MHSLDVLGMRIPFHLVLKEMSCIPFSDAHTFWKGMLALVLGMRIPFHLVVKEMPCIPFNGAHTLWKGMLGISFRDALVLGMRGMLYGKVCVALVLGMRSPFRYALVLGMRSPFRYADPF